MEEGLKFHTPIEALQKEIKVLVDFKKHIEYLVKHEPKRVTTPDKLLADAQAKIIEFQEAIEKLADPYRAPNREFKGTLKTYIGFTHSNKNILQIEVSGVENYIGNTLKVGDEVNIQHWC